MPEDKAHDHAGPTESSAGPTQAGFSTAPISDSCGSQNSAAQPAWKAVLAWCLARAGALAARSWRFVCDVVRYYWGIRQALWEYVAGFAPNLMSESTRMREVRLAPYESHRFAELTTDGWTVAIRGRCVVCGERTAAAPVDENREVDEAARAFLVPLGSLGAGALLALIYSRWLFLLSIPLGLIMGYLVRGKVRVLLRVARCGPHAARTNIPQVLAWGNTLVLRFGHKLVRKVFLYGETVDSTVPQPDAPLDMPAAEEQPAEKPPETIPLADSPHPDDATIRHSPPAFFNPEDEPESPLVP